jgi:hypothetical protein
MQDTADFPFHVEDSGDLDSTMDQLSSGLDSDDLTVMFLAGNEDMMEDSVPHPAYLADPSLQLSTSLTLSEEYEPARQRARTLKEESVKPQDPTTLGSETSQNLLNRRFQQLQMNSPPAFAETVLTVEPICLTVPSTPVYGSSPSTPQSPMQPVNYQQLPQTSQQEKNTISQQYHQQQQQQQQSQQQKFQAPPPPPPLTQAQKAAQEKEEKAASKRKRVPSTARDKKVLLERKRRRELGDCFTKLKSCLPLPLHRPSKHTVLNASCDYIKQLQQEVQRLKDENTDLRRCFVPFLRKQTSNQAPMASNQGCPATGGPPPPASYLHP